MIDINSKDILSTLSLETKKEFKEKNFILSYEEFIKIFLKNPKKISRNAAEYMLDMFKHFGIEEIETEDGRLQKKFNLFDTICSQNKKKIVGQSEAHETIYKVLEQFARQGRCDKLILLHGPNGSSKSSTAEAIANALEEYSKTDDGAIYKFNWIFPCDKFGREGLLEDSHTGKNIGFGDTLPIKKQYKTFAHLEDDEIMCKLSSEMRENPIFLLPKNTRKELFLSADTEKNQTPMHLEEGALSSKNKKIFDSLLLAYKGDLEKVLRHVQVERFFFSSQYRIGIACVEPQMAMDAQDKQLTFEKNLQNLPPVLQNIRLFEPQGELIDANRGFVEFSDLLKRPLEAFKYLLTTIEKMNINLQSGITHLDLVMIASSNEKHLDAFKNSADWPSFKGRFELVRVPYLLSVHLEEKIYADDISIIEQTKKIGPHALNLLATWAVLTRLRQPDPDFYDPSIRNLIARLDPYDKLALYDNKEPSSQFTEEEKNLLHRQRHEIFKESQSSIAYEGRFGASPREVKMLLYFAAQNESYDCLSSLAIFDEIEKLIRDRTVYDYLQFEPRNGYHDFKEFIRFIKKQYKQTFHQEFLTSLSFYNENQYITALASYLKNVSSYLKNETIQNEITGKQEPANETLMDEIETLIFDSGEKKENREKIFSKIAAWRVENPSKEIVLEKIFKYELKEISKKIYSKKEEDIKRIQSSMIMYGSSDYNKLPMEIYDVCEQTFNNLEKNFGYSKKNAWESLVFVTKSY